SLPQSQPPPSAVSLPFLPERPSRPSSTVSNSVLEFPLLHHFLHHRQAVYLRHVHIEDHNLRGDQGRHHERDLHVASRSAFFDPFLHLLLLLLLRPLLLLPLFLLI